MPQKKITYDQMYEDLLDRVTEDDERRLQEAVARQDDLLGGVEDISDEPELDDTIDTIWKEVSSNREKHSANE